MVLAEILIAVWIVANVLYCVGNWCWGFDEIMEAGTLVSVLLIGGYLAASVHALVEEERARKARSFVTKYGVYYY